MAELDVRYDTTNDFLQRHASDALREATNAARRISADQKPGLSSPRVKIDLNKPNLQAPPQFSDLFPSADGTSEEVTRLNNEVDEWIKRYFPAIDTCFGKGDNATGDIVPDDWLCGVITGNNPFGLPESVFEAIWHNARDREERQFRSAQQSLQMEFSRRGFTIPPGAYVASLEKVRQQGSEAIQEINRQQAIRNEEVKVQLLQFAVQQAVQYKLGIMSALADFYRVWVTIPNQDIERARVRAQAYSSLYSALSTYYNVEVAFEELRLKAADADVAAQISTDRNKIALYDAGGAANALGAAVRGFADVSAQAAAAASSLIAQIEGV